VYSKVYLKAILPPVRSFSKKVSPARSCVLYTYFYSYRRVGKITLLHFRIIFAHNNAYSVYFTANYAYRESVYIYVSVERTNFMILGGLLYCKLIVCL